MDADFHVFAGNANRPLAEAICKHLGVTLGNAVVKRFPDGEIDVKVNQDVRGSDVFVVQPTSPPVNEHLMELLILIDCLKRASVDRITAVLPYFGYARKDRKDEGRVPITAKLVANMIVTAGANRVLTIDLHAGQIQGFFDIPVDHLYGKQVLTSYFQGIELTRPVVVAPDVGSSKMAQAYAEKLGCSFAVVDKRRVSPEETVAINIIGEVGDRDVIVVDDLISTAGSITESARLVRSRGARRVYLCATHAVLCGSATKRLAGAHFEKLVVTDTIRQQEDVGDRLVIRSVAPLLARAVERIHRSESVSALFEDPGVGGSAVQTENGQRPAKKGK